MRVDPRSLCIAELTEAAWIVIDRGEDVNGFREPELEVRELTRDLVRACGGQPFELTREQSGLVDRVRQELLHRDQAAEDQSTRDPAVDAIAVVADLDALALHRFDQMQVLRALHAAQQLCEPGRVLDTHRALASRQFRHRFLHRGVRTRRPTPHSRPRRLTVEDPEKLEAKRARSSAGSRRISVRTSGAATSGW